MGKKLNHVEGKNKGKITLYALSTCQWCKKTKDLLADLGIDYHFIDVDLIHGDEQKEVVEELKKHNPSVSFPTLVIDNEECIIGFDEDKIKEKLK